MSKLKAFKGGDGVVHVMYINPVADETVEVPVRPAPGYKSSWDWNGDVETPTLEPSIRHLTGPGWHYCIELGRIRYCTDSPTGSPELVVDLPDFDEWDRDGVAIWVVYENPRDFPGKFVVRRWVGDAPGKWRFVAESLESARRVIPKDKTRLSRADSDDPVILETWL